MKIPSSVQNIIKLLITAAALYFVFQKIDGQELYEHILNVHPGFYLIAFIFFNLSKVLSAVRILSMYNAIGILLSHWENIKLYWIGMFYNLFLPGAIGGDAYKVYLLKQSNGGSTKQLVQATILDRLSGLCALAVLACLFFFFSSFDSASWIDVLVLMAASLGIPTFFLVTKYFFPAFLKVFSKTTLISFGVQFSQVIASIFLLISLSIFQSYTDYLTLFLISSVVAVIPFTIGGVGARELVFLYGFQYLAIDEDKAIAFTLLFFSITAFSALLGLIASLSTKAKLPQK